MFCLSSICQIACAAVRKAVPRVKAHRACRLRQEIQKQKSIFPRSLLALFDIHVVSFPLLWPSSSDLKKWLRCAGVVHINRFVNHLQTAEHEKHARRVLPEQRTTINNFINIFCNPCLLLAVSSVNIFFDAQ